MKEWSDKGREEFSIILSLPWQKHGHSLQKHNFRCLFEWSTSRNATTTKNQRRKFDQKNSFSIRQGKILKDSKHMTFVDFFW